MPSELQEQRVQPAKTSSTTEYWSAYISEEVYLGNEIIAKQAELSGRETYTGWRLPITVAQLESSAIAEYLGLFADASMDYYWIADVPFDDDFWTREQSLAAMQAGQTYSIAFDHAHFTRALAERLCEEHPEITTDSNVLSGTPHIAGTRLSVAHILAEIYHQESVDAVSKRFERVARKEQIKAAIAYAHDFMEKACDLPQDDD
jgi:uncharacterized protein (DUF433 family)